MGHATRCVPIIKQLMMDNLVILGVTPTTSIIFDEEFPTLKKIAIEPYDIKYSSWLPISLTLVMDAPRIKRVIKKEGQQLNTIIKENQVDVVISDNRFGLVNKNVECIYITHQLSIQAGWLSLMADKIHHQYIKMFDRILVPDFENEEKCLAGELSRNHTFKNVEYISPLSRLSNDIKVVEDLDYLILLSGPEPQRTVLETTLLEIAKKSTKQICIVRGSNKAISTTANKNIKVIDYASAEQLSELLLSAKKVVCRSGYSTLMDLYTLHKKNLILIPTPGQHEQEYLANYWQETRNALVLLQKDIKGFRFE